MCTKTQIHQSLYEQNCKSFLMTSGVDLSACPSIHLAIIYVSVYCIFCVLLSTCLSDRQPIWLFLGHILLFIERERFYLGYLLLSSLS